MANAQLAAKIESREIARGRLRRHDIFMALVQERPVEMRGKCE